MRGIDGCIRGVTDEAETVDRLDFSAISHRTSDISPGFLKNVVEFISTEVGAYGNYVAHDVRTGESPSVVEFRPPLTDAAKAALEEHFGAQIVYEVSEEIAVA